MSLLHLSEQFHVLLNKNIDFKLDDLLKATDKESTLIIYNQIPNEIKGDLQFTIQSWINSVFFAINSYIDIINDDDTLIKATENFSPLLVWIYDNLSIILDMHRLASRLHDESKKIPLSIICIPEKIKRLQEKSFVIFDKEIKK